MPRSINKSAIIFTVVVAFSAINIFSIPGAVNADNFDELCTIVGTEIDDVLVGTSGDDVICGLGGDDVINGETGNDRLIGGDGIDQILGDDGDDYLEGGPGADKLFGGNGTDSLLGGTDNDVLIGGASGDSLDGGDGINFCEKDKQDSATSSCFFDESGPKLISIAISTGSIDTSVNSAILTIRVGALDIGTGVKQIGLGFRIKDRTKDAQMVAGVFAATPCGTGMLPTDPDGITSLITGCRVGGDQFNGIYEMRTLIPRGTPKGSYALTSAYIEDNAGNSEQLYQADLLAKKLAVSFRQVGAGDTTEPKIVSFRMLTKSINTNRNSAIINFVVRVKDADSGWNLLTGMFSSKIGGVNRYFAVNMSNPILSCNGTVAPDPVAEQSSSSCLSSGTEFDATVNVKIRIPQYSPKGVYRLTYLVVVDKAQNRTEFANKSPWNKIGYTQIGSGDSKSPRISEISVLTPTVNTSTSDQVTKIRVKFADDVSGVEKIEIFFKPLNTWNSFWFVFDAKNQKCTQSIDTAKTEGSCLISGTLKSGVIELTSSLIAHSPAEKYYLHQVHITDYAGNGGGCWRDSCHESDQIGFSVKKIQISNTAS